MYNFISYHCVFIPILSICGKKHISGIWADEMGDVAGKVFELLEVSSEDIVTQEVTESGEYYLLKNVDFCGEKTSQIALNFLKSGYQEDVIKESETVKVWGDPQLSQVLKAETFNQYQELWFLHPMKIEKEVWEKFRKNARLVTGAWVNLSGEGGKVVHFNAYNLAVYKKS